MEDKARKAQRPMYESDQKGYSVALGNSGTYCNYRAGRLMCPE